MRENYLSTALRGLSLSYCEYLMSILCNGLLRMTLAFYFFIKTGFWFMHCHIEFHSTLGMAVMFNEAPYEQSSVPRSFPVCRDFPSNAGKQLVSSWYAAHVLNGATKGFLVTMRGHLRN